MGFNAAHHEQAEPVRRSFAVSFALRQTSGAEAPSSEWPLRPDLGVHAWGFERPPWPVLGVVAWLAREGQALEPP
eukprot:CAMPEP_0170296358 /NCGR_PEP_ID=MMETSP0116_2-20130129/48323_1 /TAXON_ID=400756 /ORGANISM="Durinskia baltica, Strain CSIRO CS-38" /LENGTH=74 /DNA_ID=CAMNT_0010547949 /DNA_START=43 /DNA_END=263 /DNA_ORIENTATION=+